MSGRRLNRDLDEGEEPPKKIWGMSLPGGGNKTSAKAPQQEHSRR